MPRNGSGIYSLPTGTDNFVANTTIESDKIDSLTADLESDANANRPIVAGGTGADTAVQAHDNLSTVSANIASGTTTDLSAATGIHVTITGTDTITGFGTEQAGATRVLTFSGVLTLTHNATSLILPGGANITTAAGDVAVMQSLGSGNWRCVGYQRADGTPIAIGDLVEDTTPQLGGDLDLNSNDITGTGNFDIAGDATFTSTDAGASAGPDFILYRNSASATYNDQIGNIIFRGKNDAAEDVDYAGIYAEIPSMEDGNEYGSLYFKIAEAPGAYLSAISIEGDTDITYFGQGCIAPSTNDGSALGDSSFSWSDLFLASGGVINWDNGDVTLTHSSGTLTTNGDMEWGSYSGTGASVGRYIDLDLAAATMSSSADSTINRQHLRFVNPNGLVGNVTTNGSATGFNTSSDQRLKENFRDFDSGAILDAISVYEYDWKSDGATGYGPKAQELYEVFPLAVSVGSGEPGDEDFQPWSWDASKVVPLLIHEVQQSRRRELALESRIAALEAKLAV